MPRKDHNSILYEPTETDDLDLGYHGSSPYLHPPNSAEKSRPGLLSPNGWLWEILTCSLSLALLALVTGTLYWMNDRPVSDWLFTTPNLTASISFLTTICTAAMMHHVSACISQLKWLFFKAESRKIIHLQRFDEASRGFLGSLALVTTAWKIHWNLAFVGALVTLLVPLFTPFVQQVIDIHPRNITSLGGNATFGFTHTYSRNISLANDAIGTLPDLQLQAATIKGIYDIETPPVFSCTSSCIWNQTQVSLGFSATCKNVTQSTLKNRRCGRISTGLTREYKCNMTTPGNIALSSSQVNTSGATSVYINVTSKITNAWIEADIMSAWPEVAKFAIYRSTPDDEWFNPTNINVTECSLNVVAYEYVHASANGSSFSFGDIRQIDLRNKNWTTAVVEDNFAGNAIRLVDGDLPAMDLGWLDLKALAAFLTSSPIVSYWFSGSGLENPNPGVSNALSGNVDLQRRLNIMATSMTDYLRSGPNRQQAQGYKVETISYVSIKWDWGILPLVIELVAVLFTIFTMVWNSRRRGVPLWKASSLALLNCQYDEKSELIQSTVTDPATLEKNAKKNIGHLGHNRSV